MKILVKPSGPDRRVPMPPPRRTPPAYFPHDKATEVDRSRYIERRLAAGDLVVVNPSPAPAKAPPAATKAES